MLETVTQNQPPRHPEAFREHVFSAFLTFLVGPMKFQLLQQNLHSPTEKDSHRVVSDFLFSHMQRQPKWKSFNKNLAQLPGPNDPSPGQEQVA